MISAMVKWLVLAVVVALIAWGAYLLVRDCNPSADLCAPATMDVT